MVNKSRLKGYGILAAVFTLGAIAGAGASRAYGRHKLAKLFAGDRHSVFEDHRLHALSRKLDLDSGQRERVSAIMHAHRDKHHEVAREMFERCGEGVRAERAKVDGEIRAVLKPDQQSRFDKLVAEQRDHFHFGPAASSSGK